MPESEFRGHRHVLSRYPKGTAAVHRLARDRFFFLGGGLGRSVRWGLKAGCGWSFLFASFERER